MDNNSVCRVSELGLPVCRLVQASLPPSFLSPSLYPSLSWDSPTLGHLAFIRPRASSSFVDVPKGHPLLQLEP